MEYVNDRSRIYLTHICEMEENAFSLQMILRNQIPGVIQPGLRYMDGEKWLYFDVTGMQPIDSFFQERELNSAEFEKLLQSIQRVQLQLQDYFLTNNGLCLQPEVLFWDLGTETFRFIYLPEQMKPCDYSKLGEYLAVHASHEDSEFVNRLYSFCQDAMTGSVYLEKYFVSSQYEATELENPPNSIEKNMKGTTPEDEITRDNACYIESEECCSYEKKTVKTRRAVLFILAAIWGISLGGAAVLFLYNKKLAFPYFRYLFFASLIVVILVKLLNRDGKSEMKNERGREEKRKNTEPKITVYEPEKDVNVSMGGIELTSKERPYEAMETVFMELIPTGRRLKGIGNCKGLEIRLDNLPVIIGKDASQVDCVIREDTVSRMHARIYEQNDTLYVQDLLSRNGVYINGVRLDPRESREIQPEDEVAFGRANFQIIETYN